MWCLPSLVSRRAAPCLCVRALIYPRDHRVLVGRDIIVSRPASSVIASRHDSPLLCILSPPDFASFVHTFLLAFVVWCVRGGVCGGRVISIFYVTLPAVWLVLVEHNKARQAGS